MDHNTNYLIYELDKAKNVVQVGVGNNNIVVGQHLRKDSKLRSFYEKEEELADIVKAFRKLKIKGKSTKFMGIDMIKRVDFAVDLLICNTVDFRITELFLSRLWDKINDGGVILIYNGVNHWVSTRTQQFITRKFKEIDHYQLFPHGSNFLKIVKDSTKFENVVVTGFEDPFNDDIAGFVESLVEKDKEEKEEEEKSG